MIRHGSTWQTRHRDPTSVFRAISRHMEEISSLFRKEADARLTVLVHIGTDKSLSIVLSNDDPEEAASIIAQLAHDRRGMAGADDRDTVTVHVAATLTEFEQAAMQREGDHGKGTVH